MAERSEAKSAKRTFVSKIIKMNFLPALKTQPVNNIA
jgi:hypothetical protein